MSSRAFAKSRSATARAAWRAHASRKQGKALGSPSASGAWGLFDGRVELLAGAGVDPKGLKGPMEGRLKVP